MCTLGGAKNRYNGRTYLEHMKYRTRNPAIAEGPRDAGVPVEIW